MGDLDAIGGAVTGGLLARAVEPDAGEPVADGHTQESNCLNCGARLAGPYCASCGQKARVRRSVRAFSQDFVQGLFNFEGKIWRTLPMLAWRPGELTRRYIAGERARFVSPVALYLFTVFLMFAVLSFSGALDSDGGGPISTSFETALSGQKQEIAELEGERTAAAAAGRQTAAIDRKLAEAKEDLAGLEKIAAGGPEFQAEFGDETPRWVQAAVLKAQRNPELIVTNIQDTASKYSWLLIPLSVPFLWLLFPFSGRYHMYDHTVFVTYSLSFMMMLVILGGLLVMVGASAAAGFLFFVPPFHMYRQLKGAYQLGRFGTWWRTIVLVTFAFVAAGLFFTVVAAVGLA